MALQDQDRVVKTYTSSGTIHQFRCVKLTSTANTVEECSVAGEAVWGIAETAGTDGGRIDVCLWGETKGEIGADVTLHADLATANDGQLTDNDASDDYIVCKALEDGTAAGEHITVWLYGPSHLDQVGQ